MEYQDVVLGQKYIDSVTSFIGTATAKAEYFAATGRIQLEAQVEGKPVSVWVDVNRISPAQ